MNSKIITAVGVALLSATLASAAPQTYGNTRGYGSTQQSNEYVREARRDDRQIERVQRRYRATSAALQLRIDETERDYRFAVRQNRVARARQLQHSLQLLRTEQIRQRDAEAREVRLILGTRNSGRRY